MLSFSQLSSICDGKILLLSKDRSVEDLITDSRKALISEHALFFAIRGDRHDGHQYIQSLHAKGIRQFVVEDLVTVSDLPDANILHVKSSIQALQAIASFHRKQFSIPVIAITGSNGKTIIKEWLYQLLSAEYKIVKNPGSYNSQLGVALSVWQMQSHHELGIFEAGISQPSEMVRLESIIQPTLGIFTNLGTAHDEGFSSAQQKLEEKLKLFTHVKQLLYCSDQSLPHTVVQSSGIPSISWGFNDKADIKVSQYGNMFSFEWKGERHHLLIPFNDKASLENCFHCIALMLFFGYSTSVIQERISLLKTVPMRLELKQAINGCQIIDDSYNNDLGGLRIGLDFLGGIQKKKKTLILSDILQSGLSDVELIRTVISLLAKSDVTKLIAVGSTAYDYQQEFDRLTIPCFFYKNTHEALRSIDWSGFQQEVILIKGARVFHFEKIAAHLQRKVHGTRMEIDLNKIVHNFNFFKSRLKPGVKIMVMVKAFAYGSGSEEIATLLQYHRADYLGVAYADEGVELRKNQISIPIMVMNATEESFQNILDNNLEPVMYSLNMLRAYAGFLNGKQARVHLEIETGMKRLGLEEEDLSEVVDILGRSPNIKVASMFSHLAGADESDHDNYSNTQFTQFEKAYKFISDALAIKPLRHILNSPGILRLPDYQLDMVRLGIGLYGINPTAEKMDQLKPAATLKTVISQIKKVPAGETIGYGRKGKAEKNLTLATIAIGYADGFSRIFSRGAGVVVINGKLAPVIGNVCMDMTMIDVTSIEAKEGDDVIIFGDDLPIQEVAARAHTIPYEILTNTSERVKRIFYAESM